MHQSLILAAGLLLAGNAWALKPNNEPIQPIPPIKVSNPALVELGKKFSPEENAKIVAFLKSLNGKQPEIVLPILPPRER